MDADRVVMLAVAVGWVGGSRHEARALGVGLARDLLNIGELQVGVRCRPESRSSSEWKEKMQ